MNKRSNNTFLDIQRVQRLNTRSSPLPKFRRKSSGSRDDEDSKHQQQQQREKNSDES